MENILQNIKINPETALKISDYVFRLDLEAQDMRYKNLLEQDHIDKIILTTTAQVEAEADALPKEDKSLSNAEKRNARIQSLLKSNATYEQAISNLRVRNEHLAKNAAQARHALRIFETIQSFAHTCDKVQVAQVACKSDANIQTLFEEECN